MEENRTELEYACAKDMNLHDEIKTIKGTYIIDTKIPFDSDCYETAIWVEIANRCVGDCPVVELYPVDVTEVEIIEGHEWWVKHIQKKLPDYLEDCVLDMTCCLTCEK